MLPLDLFIVRHGKSEGNSALGKFIQNQDAEFDPEFLKRHNSQFRLTDKGKDQCPASGVWLKEWLKEKKLAHFDQYFVSTHIRACETAALLNLPDAAWEQDSQLHERDNGLWGVIPNADWQKRYEESILRNRFHGFYTPHENGESISDVCNRLRPFVSTLDRQEVNQKRVIVVAHGDVSQAFRVILERITPVDFHERWIANKPDFRIGNGQILHYTRVDPSEPTCTHHDRFRWVRSVNPWCPTYAGHDWRFIEKRYYSNEKLIDMVERFPPLIKD